jgi:hypothetical protein
MGSVGIDKESYLVLLWQYLVMVCIKGNFFKRFLPKYA